MSELCNHAANIVAPAAPSNHNRMVKEPQVLSLCTPRLQSSVFAGLKRLRTKPRIGANIRYPYGSTAQFPDPLDILDDLRHMIDRVHDTALELLTFHLMARAKIE